MTKSQKDKRKSSGSTKSNSTRLSDERLILKMEKVQLKQVARLREENIAASTAELSQRLQTLQAASKTNKKPTRQNKPRGKLYAWKIANASPHCTKEACKTKYKMSPSSVRSEGREAAAGYCLNSVSYRVDEAVKYNVLNSD